jgi:pSer/pThr/pTyr-binding forkhead associated (FHA) protein
MRQIPKLYLQLYEKFPSAQAGELIELDPAIKGGWKEDSIWLIGKIKYCDIKLTPPEDRDASYHYLAISRIQATIAFDHKLSVYRLLDGGVYVDSESTSPGEGTKATPSSNGCWLNGERLIPNDWATLEIGDRIHFGNDKRILVRGSLYETENNLVWDDSNWQHFGERAPSTDTVDEKRLLDHAKSNASPWSLLDKVLTYLMSPSVSKQDRFIKLLLASSGIAIALSTEFRDFIKWLLNR